MQKERGKLENARALHDLIIVRREPAPPRPSGIVIPDSAIYYTRRWTAEVISVGRDVKDSDICEGIRVLVDPRRGGKKVDLVGYDEMEIFVNEINVIAIVAEGVNIECRF